MKLKRITPMLWTAELDETVAFYKNVLGFEVSEYNEEWGWAALCNDQADIMIARPNEHTPFQKPQFTGSFYFYPENVDQLWEALKTKCKIAYPLDNFEYGMREFAVYDNNGYMLQFGNELNS